MTTYPNKSLKFMQLNAQHKRAANSAWQAEIIEKDVDVALIQEPYITKNGMIPGLPSNYLQYSNGISAKSAVIVRRSLSHFHLSSFLSDDLVAVAVTSQTHGRLVVCSIYCPCTADAIPSSFTSLLSAEKGKGKLIAGIDTNGHSSFVGYNKSDTRAQAWEEILVSENLRLHNTFGAKTFRNTRGNESTIDWTITDENIGDRIVNWHVDESGTCLSDHMHILFELRTDVIEIPKSQYDFKRGDWNSFQILLTTELANSPPMDYSSSLGLDKIVDNLMKCICKVIDLAIPKTKPRRNRNLWWNNSLQTLKTKVRRARRQHDTSYLELKRQYEIEILNAKQESWKRFLSSTEGQDDSLVRYRILCKDKRAKTLNAIVTSNGKETETEKETAELLLQENFPDLRLPLTRSQAEIDQFVTENLKTNKETEDDAITEEEVRRVIAKLRPGKAPGFDGLPGLLFQKSASVLVPSLTKLFDSCFQVGYFPAAWKQAKVVFIQKPNKTGREVKHFRPISLLPVMGKIYEKTICARITWHADQNSWIDNKQFGFQRGTGAEHAALKLSNAGYTAFKKRKEMVAVFLDISGAFNEVWHAGLIYKLIKQGTPMGYIRFMQSYLSGRTACVQTTDSSKVIHNLTQSCPQGSTISPVMWNILLNGLILEVGDKANVIGFADDFVLYAELSKDESPQDVLGPALQAVSQWGISWKIPFSQEKTKAMLFSRLRRRERDIMQFQGVDVQWTETFKYLGIVFDSKLKWGKHIDHITARASTTLAKLNGLCGLKWGLRSETARFVYERAVLPMILYGAIVWGRAIQTKNELRKLSRVQKLATLSMTGALRTSALDSLQVLTGMLPIQFKIEERAALQFLT